MKFRLAAISAILFTLAFANGMARRDSAEAISIPADGECFGPVAMTCADGAGSHARLIVSPTGPYTAIQSALRDAHPGDEIQVRGGVYREALIVDKPVKLVGVANPIIDGSKSGTVVTLAAEGIEFRGFTVQGSGVEPDQDHAGILVTAPHVVVENNYLRDVLFGVVAFKAGDSILRGNDITSKTEYTLGRKGDAIRLWSSPRVSVIGNHIHDARDIVVWYSTEALLRDNVVERGRYGVHLMYAQNSVIERNRLNDNSVGAFAMYSSNVVMRENEIRGQRGPSGYAIGFKDADNVEAYDNVLVDNRGGIFIDGTPFSPDAFSRFRNNIVAFNDVGAIFLPASRGSAFENNSFWENVEQISVQGGGLLAPNIWKGNFWSDYAGFDANRDGVGETPYRSERFFENMMDREQNLRVLLYSPAVQAIEFAAVSFPIVKPQPKLTDATPRVDPLSIPTFVARPQSNGAEMAIVALALLALGAVCGAVSFASLRGALAPKESPDAFRRLPRSARDDTWNGENSLNPETASVRALNVVKRYGKSIALDGISFDARAGEAIALWGPNGAGKTTLIKAILGLIDYQGDVWVESENVRQHGKLARRSIGYVPQEAVFYDWSVHATMEFYARLKRVGKERRAPLLERLGLSEHAHKSVAALSGGLKQRLALAIALLADPPVLLFDEPTASLDARARSDYLALITTLRKEDRTIIFASHRLEEVEALADRVLVLEEGRMVGVVTPEELRARLMPEVEMTLWIAEPQRAAALAYLEEQGLAAHFNGRGTVVVRVPNEKKIDPLRLLDAQGIAVLNFEIERGRVWN